MRSTVAKEYDGDGPHDRLRRKQTFATHPLKGRLRNAFCSPELAAEVSGGSRKGLAGRKVALAGFARLFDLVVALESTGGAGKD